MQSSDLRLQKSQLWPCFHLIGRCVLDYILALPTSWLANYLWTQFTPGVIWFRRKQHCKAHNQNTNHITEFRCQKYICPLEKYIKTHKLNHRDDDGRRNWLILTTAPFVSCPFVFACTCVYSQQLKQQRNMLLKWKQWNMWPWTNTDLYVRACVCNTFMVGWRSWGPHWPLFGLQVSQFLLQCLACGLCSIDPMWG